ncbi:MAG: tetratricopeptide repeat protein [Alphaproteobacteria bacterium]|nr:tetratricopeptide repeat protein [Alphaproteobacteria bacterium]
MTGWYQVCKGLVVALALSIGVAATAAPVSETLMYAGDVEAALKEARREAEADPADIAAQERLIDILLTLGLDDRAVDLYRKRVQASPTDPNAHYLLGRALPDARGARESYEKALKFEPTHARSHMGMGAIHTAHGDFDAAIDAYSRATRFDGSLAEAWLGLSRAHLAKDDVAGALDVSRKAMEAAPNDPDAYLTVAVLDPANARQVLEQAAKLASGDPRVHASLAEVRLAENDAKGAIAAADAALAIDPTEPAALKAKLFARSIASGALDLDGYRRLIAARENGGDFDALVARYPKSAVVLAGRSQARLQTGDVAGATADLEKAVAIDPDEAEICAAYGLVLLQQKRADDAIPWLAKAVAARQWDGSLGIAFGRALTAAGRHDEAITAMAALSSHRRFDSDVAIAHADALLAAGRAEEAYQVVLGAAERRMDDKLVIALMAVATQTGRYAEAADIVEQIAIATKDPKARDLAARLRAKAQ